MLRFDDKTGAEEVKFHAEKDLNTTVKNNETHTVNADRTKTIIHNETTKIHIDRTEDVFGKHTETIKGNRNVKVTEGGSAPDCGERDTGGNGKNWHQY